MTPPDTLPRTQTIIDLARANLAPDANGYPHDLGRFRGGQIASVMGHLPWVMACNIVAAAVFWRLAHTIYPPGSLWGWSAVIAAATLILLAIWWRTRRDTFETADLRSISHAEVGAGLMALAWAAFPALFFEAAPAELRIFIVAVLMAAAGVGAFALARIPSAAIVFALTATGSLAMAAFRLGGPLGTAFAAMALAYGIMMAGMILTMHRAAIERSQDTRALERQREIIALLLKDFERNASDWLWETDVDGKLVYFSPRFAEVSNRAAQRLAGSTLRQTADADIADRGWQAIEEAMTAGRTFADLIVEVPRAGGAHWWRLTAHPIVGRDGSTAGYRGVGRDCTEERRAQRDLIAAKETAENSSAAKSQFLGVMSHELKTPLNAITGFAQLLASPGAAQLAPEAHAEYARTILDSGLHLRALIDDILDVTRMDRGKLQLVDQESDAGEIAEIAVRMCGDIATVHRVTVVAELPTGIELVCDITRIRQVIVNLVTNAVKFSAPGAEVRVAIGRGHDGEAVLSVKDDGIGIQPGDLARIFEPFEQAESGMSRKFGGIGLGLSIARRIARLHGGDVKLTSEAGRGTVACLILPSERVRWPSRAAAKPALARSA